MNTYVHANSGNRDKGAYPSGNNYSLYLPYPIKNITKVEVVVARVPNTMYNITSNIQQIDTRLTNITIPPGFYGDPSLLASAIHDRLPISGLNNEDFLWLPSEGKFIYLTNDAAGFFTTLTDDMSTILGFDTNVRNNVLAVPADNSVVVTTFSYYVKSKYVGDMSKNDFLFLNIAELSHEKFQDATSEPYNAQNATGLFTGITMDVAPNTVKIFKNNDYPIAIKYDPPISSIDRLTISWYDKNRNLVNFQGMEDNAVILRFEVVDKPTGELDWIDEEEEREEIPPPPPPPKVKEKKTFGKWFLFLLLTAIFAIWFAKKRVA